MPPQPPRLASKTVILLSVAAYFLAVPLLSRAGNGYFTIVSLVPVITVGLLQGQTRGVAAAAAFTPINFALVGLIEGSFASMTAAGGLLGTASLFAVGWLVGYLHDLSSYRLNQVVEEKDRLIGTISHELRTPLSTVLGLSHELAERIDVFTNEEIVEFCTLIAQQSADLEALIEDLLVAARADIERIKVASGPVDLAEAARSAVTLVANRPDWTKSTSVRTNGAGVVAAADGLRVRQIIRNLLQNAERYGGDDVEVFVHRKSGRCAVTVSDNGRGVSLDEIDGIFDPHVRAHKRDGNTESLGLGLYVSQTLARLMKGDLEYRRESGRTFFDLTLPAADNESRALSP
ncbi:MAG: HAMP domain-containing sensor histidine kinase [Acidimicrobiia bacterium]|nr:HAMP domain-containing sensor histidine kinase [Acidimicrobiia bacterium]